ncbi:PLP-dependent aminotransferase family protein [Halomonas sp. ML-15]|uniref:aminotransferase-like domain-containing protein n=1 Tax=Halomonas sp. ML-15 TaxID=2773305 RepID=UPI001747994B|nr:PLP-dependent aminotransferase family protein [Halomonas sp. ML-15]MBD3896906.1 PLP-dependent aminotransferase family protein [Halomonas sp. ML-15]
MKLRLDSRSSTPMVQQLVDAIREWIEQHGVADGQRLPSIRRLSAEHGISRNAVIEAYDQLVAHGVIRARPGSGFYVAINAAGETQTPSVSMEDVTDEMWRLFQADEGDLKLGCGWLPNHWREDDDLTYAIRQVARQGGASLFEYSTPMGTPRLRQLIQERLRLLDINTQANQILMTGGGSHSLDLIVRLLLSPGDVVFVEAPGYYNLFGLLHLQRVTVVGVPRLCDGPDTQRLEALLHRHRPKLFFTNSVFQNPTGTTLAPTIAHRVLQLAQRHDVQIVEDDIYADFQAQPTTRLAALDGLERVIYLGSFSKSLSSSLRVGFIASQAPLLKRLVDIKMLTAISTSPFAEQVVATLLENGSYRKLTERLRIKLAAQLARTLALVKQAGWEVFATPAGGMFLWVRHPAVERSSQLVERAAQLGIRLSPGDLFFPHKDASPWLRLNVAYANDPRAKRFIEQPLLSTGI